MFSLKKKVVNDIQYFRSCGELFYYNFYRILETKDLRYLIVDWDERLEITYDKEIAKTFWKNIYREYSELKKDNSMLNYIEICSELIYYETKLVIVSSLIEVFGYGNMDKKTTESYFESLSKWGIRANINAPMIDEIPKIIRQLKQVKNKISLLKEEKKQYDVKEEDHISLAKQVVKMEQALGRNEVDPKTTTVEKWIYLIEEIKEMQLARQKGYGRE